MWVSNQQSVTFSFKFREGNENNCQTLKTKSAKQPLSLSSRRGEALCDDPKNGCLGDY